MKRVNLSKEWAKVSEAVADEFYPKGESERRGEFLRDQGLLFAKFLPVVNRAVNVPVAVKAVMLAEDIMEVFENDKSGIASDIAWYELIEYCEQYYRGQLTAVDVSRYVEGVFGFDGMAEFLEVKNKSVKRHEAMDKLLNGGEDAVTA